MKLSIVQYSEQEKARVDYPFRIVSPPRPSICCVEGNRTQIGQPESEEGESYIYKRCRVCGHTVRFFFCPRYKSTALEVRAFRRRAGQTIH